MKGLFNGKLGRILSWALGGMLVASTLWAATGWRVDSFGNITGGRSSVILSQGQALNCKLKVASTTLSVVGDDDAALSVSNPCKIRVNDTTGGTHIATFSSPVSVTFGVTSDTDSNLFGLANAVDWDYTMPFFLHVITNGTLDYMAISRRPLATSGSASTALCQKGDTDCDSSDDAMILTTGLTLASWTSKVMTLVGVFDATRDGSDDAYTFAIGSNNTSGFNKDRDLGIRHRFALGHNANTNHYLSGTTPPAWATPDNMSYYYWFQTYYTLCIAFTTTSAGNVSNGTGGNALNLSVPFPIASWPSNNTWFPIGSYQAGGTVLTNGVLMGFVDSNAETALGLYQTGLTSLDSDDFTATSNDITVNYCYALQ